MNLPERPPKQQLFKGITHGFLGWQLLILLAVTASVCYFLARSLTAPISQLRQATRKFAAGDLSTRIGKKIKGKNEISGLAGDFDDMASKIEDLVGAQKRLLRDISHELRSPLTRLGIALELARKQASPETQEKALARIELESERMNTMIGQLLRLTRFETGASDVNFTRVDLHALLVNMVQDANFEAAARGCQVTLDSAEGQMINGSLDLLTQALENVIRNAVKYTDDNTSVRVNTIKAGEELVIQVLDKGPGVPDNALKKLFDPFYRVADARDRKTGGTGIGLAIAERSIKLHGGTILAENCPAGGLKVTIVLPLND
jgi:two-component system sensor histidine kinase CpxA